MLFDADCGRLRSGLPGERMCTESQGPLVLNVSQAAVVLSCATATIVPLALFRSV
jgi:hypothetical protein